GGLSVGNTVLLVNSQFDNNTAQGDGVLGGGAVAASLAITAVNSHFTGNTAATSGGGALGTAQGLYLFQSDFTNNTATLGDGGAAFAQAGATLDVVVLT